MQACWPGQNILRRDYKAFTINKIFNCYSNSGDGSYNRYTSNAAFEFPKASGKTAVFEDGVVWGGLHKGRSTAKVGGSAYRHGLQAGRILTPGGPTEAEVAIADDPLKPQYRIYRVRPDVTPTTAFTDVQGILQDEAALIARSEPGVTAQKLFEGTSKTGTNGRAKDRRPMVWEWLPHAGRKPTQQCQRPPLVKATGQWRQVGDMHKRGEPFTWAPAESNLLGYMH